MVSVYLVRHGRPLVEPTVPAATWGLDPAAFGDVWALRESGRLPATANWFSSPEPKAVQTAELLVDDEVAVVPALAEQERGAGWVEDLPAAVRAAFARPDEPAAPGWESLDTTRARVVPAVCHVVATHPGDIVLVGHGTAWTLVAAELTGTAPDLGRWARLRMPDVIEVAR